MNLSINGSLWWVLEVRGNTNLVYWKIWADAILCRCSIYYVLSSSVWHSKTPCIGWFQVYVSLAIFKIWLDFNIMNLLDWFWIFITFYDFIQPDSIQNFTSSLSFLKRSLIFLLIFFFLSVYFLSNPGLIFLAHNLNSSHVYFDGENLRWGSVHVLSNESLTSDLVHIEGKHFCAVSWYTPIHFISLQTLPNFTSL